MSSVELYERDFVYFPSEWEWKERKTELQKKLPNYLPIYVTNSRYFCKFSQVSSNVSFCASPQPPAPCRQHSARPRSTLSIFFFHHCIPWITHFSYCPEEAILFLNPKPLHVWFSLPGVPFSTWHISISLLRPSPDVTTFVKSSPSSQGELLAPRSTHNSLFSLFYST